MSDRVCIAIDLKSFYASVECVERGLDPLTTNLVVADESRTDKTICLAVSPGLKRYGLPGRIRLFEAKQIIAKINAERASEGLDPITFITAMPRMALYMDYSTRVYNIYLKYIAPEDIHVYSVDEVFIEATEYLNFYKMSARELTMMLIREVLDTTGITATAGIGTNLYLCKIAMDIEAKHIEADANGVRIAELDEMSYRRKLWDHTPITDFWRVGPGYARKLAERGMYTMGDVARCSIGKPGEYYSEDMLYKLFGVNAELLIDHAWGYEPTRMTDIKSYKPEANSFGSAQVLKCPYTFDKARLVAREMADKLSFDLLERGLVTNQIVLTVGYDKTTLEDPEILKRFHGEIKQDYYGRTVPAHAHGSRNLRAYTESAKEIIDAATDIFDREVVPYFYVRRIGITAMRVIRKKDVPKETTVQMNLFTDFAANDDDADLTSNAKTGVCSASNVKTGESSASNMKTGADAASNAQSGATRRRKKLQASKEEKESRLQDALLTIKKRYGRNAVLRGMNLEEGGTAIERNEQIGGHRA